MSVKVFIDGSSGTTGLRIADRLAARPEIELLSISAEGRKDVNERAKVINSADLAFLCLPDAASREVMPLLRPDVKVLDTSTAFRTDAAWDYGFPELKGQKEKIKNSDRVAVPGCYASGFISIARPLVELGLAPKDYPFSCTGISGYSGGGKKMIAEYESADRPAHSKLDAPKSYGLSLAHKHLPEMKEISGLAHTPMFVPVVCDYYCGMQVLVPLDLTVAGTTAEAVAAGLADYYKDAATVKVHALNEPLPENGLYSNAMAGTDRIGYVADYPSFGVPANINAFALGARMVNPRARIELRWTCLPDQEDPLAVFTRKGITVVSGRDAPVPGRPQQEFGTFLIRPGGVLQDLATPFWHWGQFYENVVHSVLDGGWVRDKSGTDGRAVNYWWGMNSGVMDVLLSRELPSDVAHLARILRTGVTAGMIDPFACRITDQNGTVRNSGRHGLDVEQIVHMDYLCDAVDGTIPEYDDLTEQARPMYRMQGIHRDQLPAEKEATL